MNVILIIVDSLRQDHVGVYHGGGAVFHDVPACQTPNLDRFAQDCIIFDNAYPEALPTIPIRTQVFTGQRTLPYRPWQPLDAEDITMAEILRAEGYISGLISDTYHYRAPGMNYHRGFHTYRWIRGQEFDPWTSNPPRRNVHDYTNPNYTPHWRKAVSRFLANTDDFQGAEDWFAAQLMRESVDWLTRNREHPRVLAVIDSFDPHEPWDPPKKFDTYTDSGYQGSRLIMPMGGHAKTWASAEEIRHIRGLYAGEAAFVDDQLGQLFATLAELGYFEDSIIFLFADHGHPLADHGKFLKGGDRLYNELLRIPFMVRMPEGKGARRTPAIVQFHDILPTILDFLGLANSTDSMHGRSFLPVLGGKTDQHRQYIITGYHEDTDRCIRDEQWSLILRGRGQRSELYHLNEDPREHQNLIEKYTDQAKRLTGAFGNYFRMQAQREIGQLGMKGIQGKYELGSGMID